MKPYAELVKEETGVWSEDGAGGDETEQLAPPTEVRTGAWSDEERDDQPVRDSQSWKQVGLIAAAIFVPLTALVVIIGLWLQEPRKPPVPEPSRVPQDDNYCCGPPAGHGDSTPTAADRDPSPSTAASDCDSSSSSRDVPHLPGRPLRSCHWRDHLPIRDERA